MVTAVVCKAGGFVIQGVGDFQWRKDVCPNCIEMPAAMRRSGSLFLRPGLEDGLRPASNGKNLQWKQKSPHEEGFSANKEPSSVLLSHG